MTAFAASDTIVPSVAAELNVTPLVDVMLVLLVIFMLAVPLTTQRLALSTSPPCVAGCPAPTKPVRLAVKRTGELYWNGAAVSQGGLVAQMQALAREPQSSTLEVHVEANARYALLTGVLSAASNAGVRQIRIADSDD